MYVYVLRVTTTSTSTITIYLLVLVLVLLGSQIRSVLLKYFIITWGILVIVGEMHMKDYIDVSNQENMAPVYFASVSVT